MCWRVSRWWRCQLHSDGFRGVCLRYNWVLNESHVECILWYRFHLVLLFFFSIRRRHTRCLSDWSSDVCSSDLPVRGEPHDRRLEAAEAVHRRVPVLQREAVAIERVLEAEGPHGHGGYEEEDHDGVPEIGRASCRERGQIVGVARALNERTDQGR